MRELRDTGTLADGWQCVVLQAPGCRKLGAIVGCENENPRWAKELQTQGDSCVAEHHNRAGIHL